MRNRPERDSVMLHEIVGIRYGKALKESERVSSGSIPVFGSNGIVGTHNASIIDKPTIVIGRKGSVGAISYAPNGGWPIDTTFYVEPKTNGRVDLRYLYHALKNVKLEFLAITTSIPGLNRDALYQVAILLPSLPEQRRIAAVLDAADGLRAKRRAALARLDALLQSVFLEMFGDPVRNERGWPLVAVKDVAANEKYSIKAGPFGSSLLKEFYVSSGYKIYGQEQVIRDDLSFGDYYIDETKYQSLYSNRVQAGDILISLVGTFGKVSVVPVNFQPGIINPRLMKITLDHDKMLPSFFKQLLAMPTIISQLEDRSHGGTMGIVNVGIMKEVVIPKPPIELQMEYVSRLEKITSQKYWFNEGILSLDSLFASLQQRAFRGEL